MPRDKSANHEKIMKAAYDEFLTYGFQDASMRRIAASCGMSASGLYKHFPGKEEMFAALVDPVIEGFMNLYHTVEAEYFDNLGSASVESAWQGQGEPVRAMQYIYDHIDEFRLIICKSQGTKYESFTHEIAKLEEEATLRYIRELKKKGYPVKNVNRREFHLLLTAYVEAMFQAVTHDFSGKEAMHYAKTIESFYGNAWKDLFGL